MEQKEAVNKIVVIGPSGVGKSQVFENLKEREKTTFVANREATTGASKGSVMTAELWDVAGDPKYQALLPMYLKDATVAVLVVDPDILANENALNTLSIFLKNISTSAPGAKVKIVVNKVDGVINKNIEADDHETIEIRNIKEECYKKIQDHRLLPDDFDAEKDIIFYSAKDAAKKFQQGGALEQDPIIQSILPHLDLRVAQVVQKENDPILPEIDWNAIWKSLKSNLIPVGKVLLFILLTAALTTVVGAIGFGIGLAAGAWAGPGAFVTAIAGAFAGAVTAWNLAVLIAAPVLGLALTGIGFGLFKRWQNTPPKVYDLVSEKDNPMEIELQLMGDSEKSRERSLESSTSYKPIPGSGFTKEPNPNKKQPVAGTISTTNETATTNKNELTQ